ncbi:MAG TPA: hypothetical protein VET45_17110 [Candidatus Binatia bacterium]|nr:hypothetical protein [Candidatus Binatia bacterium]
MSPRTRAIGSTRETPTRRGIVALGLFGLALFAAMVGDASAVPSRACSAPPLPAPSGNVVPVSTEAQLQAAVQSLTSGTTILIQPGTYLLTSTLWVNRDVQDVAIRGSTSSCDDVVLVGPGMSNASYGGVPHGIWIGNARRILIANLTIKDVYYHPIQLDPGPGAQAPRIYNVRLVDAGEQFIKSSLNAGGVNDGIVEYSVMEYTTTARSAYTNGVDVHQGANWIIRHNLFRNMRAPAGQLAGPAILMWNRSRDTIVEGNLLLNCQYGIALGLDPGRPDDHVGGIVRNNFFHRSGAQSGDVGITVNNSAGTKVLNNTVVLSGTYPNAIEYRFPATTGVEIRFNLADAAVQQRDGASGVVSGNVTTAQPGWFVDAIVGDLHLTAAAIAAIDRAAPHPDVTRDYDQEARPAGAAPDIGADELRALDGPPSPPTNLLVR